MKGPRLEFVVRPIKGKVKRFKHSFDPTKRKISATEVVEDGGYIIYLPTGASYRLSHKDLVKRGFDRQPNILNFETVNDTRTPAGRYKFAMNDKAREIAWKALEDQVIKACVRKHGPVVLEDDYDATSA